jgi:hypothetical protein
LKHQHFRFTAGLSRDFRPLACETTVHEPAVDKLSMLQFMLGFNQHTARFDNAFNALLQGVPKPRREDLD